MLRLLAVNHVTGEILELSGEDACRETLLGLGLDPQRTQRLLHQARVQNRMHAEHESWHVDLTSQTSHTSIRMYART